MKIETLSIKRTVLSLSCQDETVNNKLVLKGYSNANSNIKIFVDKGYVKTVSAKSNGSYNTDIILNERGKHVIEAVRDDDDSITASQQVVFAEDVLAITKFEFEYVQSSNDRKIIDLLENANEEIASVNPDYEMIFRVAFSKPEEISAVNDITFNGLKLYIKKTRVTEQIDLSEDTDDVPGDYRVNYLNNQKAGIATAVFTGVNGYTDVLKKSFRILPAKYADSADKFDAVFSDENAASKGIEYSKGGAKPGVTIKYTNGDGFERILDEKTDYTLKYLRNTTVNDCSNVRNLPTVQGDCSWTEGYSGSWRRSISGSHSK